MSPSLYHAKSKTYRRNVEYRGDRVRRGIAESRGEMALLFSCYESMSGNDLDAIPEPVQKWFKNGTAKLVKCQKCQRIIVMQRKIWRRFGMPMIKIHGEYWCKGCHINIPKHQRIWERLADNKKRQVIYQKLYNGMIKGINKGNAFQGQTHVRQMTPDERKMYGLPENNG